MGYTSGTLVENGLRNLKQINLTTIRPEINRIPRGGSRTAATSKMERFVIIVNGFEPLTIITKCSILDFPAALDPPLIPVLPSLPIKYYFHREVQKTQQN